MLSRIFGWVLPYKKHLLVLVLIAAAFTGAYMLGRADGNASCQKQFTNALNDSGASKFLIRTRMMNLKSSFYGKRRRKKT